MKEQFISDWLLATKYAVGIALSITSLAFPISILPGYAESGWSGRKCLLMALVPIITAPVAYAILRPLI